MGTVLHPVGPEPARTYWIRRALIVGAVLIVVIIVMAVMISSNGSAAADDPPPGDPGLSATPTSTTEVSPATITPTPMATATPTATATALRTSSPSPTSTPSALVRKASPRPTPTKIAPVACRPSQLRATLTGKQRLKPKALNTFALSLINGAPITCVLSVNPRNFELKIYSGTDRIWSSNDCARLVTATTKTLASQQALEWKMTWNGRRSRAGCGRRPEIPKPGTYFATAQYAGAAPVQLRMLLHR
jgi:hypothetical protein